MNILDLTQNNIRGKFNKELPRIWVRYVENARKYLIMNEALSHFLMRGNIKNCPKHCVIALWPEMIITFL